MVLCCAVLRFILAVQVLKQVASDIGCGVHLHLEVEDKSSAGTTRRVIFNGPPVCFPAAEDHIRGLVSEYVSPPFRYMLRVNVPLVGKERALTRRKACPVTAVNGALPS